jgi:outer membrane protein TolC
MARLEYIIEDRGSRIEDRGRAVLPGFESRFFVLCLFLVGFLRVGFAYGQATPGQPTSSINPVAAKADKVVSSSSKSNSADEKTPEGFATKLGPSPSGSDVRILPINLPTTLRLADASNPTIALARERINEAYAHLREAQVLLLPSLQTGPAYVRHDGLLQNSTGLVFDTSKWNFFEGGGATLFVETSDAVFAPRIARRLLDAQSAAAQGVTNTIQLEAAVGYLNLLGAYGALAINAETVSNAEQAVGMAEQAVKAELGKTPADANRLRTELDLRKQERIDLEAKAAVASAKLAQLLMMDATADLQPSDTAIVPISLVSTVTSLDELVATGLMNRPELAESRALVEAALARWRQARTGPLLPRLEVDYFAGVFGGGINDNTQRFGGRGDGLAQAVWTLHNLGAGDVALARARRSQYNQTNLHVRDVEAQVAAEITAAAKLVRARQRSLSSAQDAVRQAEKAWPTVLKTTFNATFLPGGAGVRRFEALELLWAERDLDQARRSYLTEVIEYNRSQFQLYWSLGQPPLESLPKLSPLPVQTPVLPPEKAGK